jgi:thymidylate synthase
MKMQSLIHPIQAESCPTTWLEAVEYLLGLPNREAYNLIIGVESPREMTPHDFKIFDLVDAFLRKANQLPLTTIAGTIFPANHYLRNQAKGVYEDFPNEMSKLKKESWGTYALRMLRKEGKNGTINPLQEMVEKLQKYSQLNRSAYEINLADEVESSFEIPIYDAKDDFKRLLGQPCLSHLTFKVYGGNALMLTVMYRSHFYVTKALGNLLGLAQLQSFVAEETGLDVGPLICHSTHARIDTAKGATLAGINQLVSLCRKV